jgi:hypothetical protein
LLKIIYHLLIIFFYFLSNVDAQNMLVGGGTSGASGSGTAGEAPPAAGPPV